MRRRFKNNTKIKNIFLYLLLMILSLPSYVYAKIPRDCPATDGISTYPSKVIIDDLVKDVRELKDSNENRILEITPEFKKNLYEIFNEKPFRTKMDQFYRMIYLIHTHALKNEGSIEISGVVVANVLLASAVFSDPSFPKHIDKVVLAKKKSTLRTHVYFNLDNLKLPLNEGNGFYSFEDGKCQHLTHLHFTRKISFDMDIKKNNNLLVSHFQGVNLFGDFGTRGFVDIDLSYIKLEKVEFIDKTTEGYVTARIADREFKEKQHSWFLKLVNKFYSNTTRQPIDW